MSPSAFVLLSIVLFYTVNVQRETLCIHKIVTFLTWRHSFVRRVLSTKTRARNYERPPRPPKPNGKTKSHEYHQLHTLHDQRVQCSIIITPITRAILFADEQICFTKPHNQTGIIPGFPASLFLSLLSVDIFTQSFHKIMPLKMNLQQVFVMNFCNAVVTLFLQSCGPWLSQLCNLWFYILRPYMGMKNFQLRVMIQKQ